MGLLGKDVRNGKERSEAAALVLPWLSQLEHSVLKGEERSWPDLLSAVLFCLPVGFIKCAGSSAGKPAVGKQAAVSKVGACAKEELGPRGLRQSDEAL